jgi:hypothetical protein
MLSLITCYTQTLRDVYPCIDCYYVYCDCYQQIHYAEDIPLLFRLTARCEDSVRKIVSATSRGQDPDQQTTKAQYDLAVQVARYVLYVLYMPYKRLLCTIVHVGTIVTSVLHERKLK